MKKIKACILAAGIGTRLAPLTETKPKPIIPIAGKPLLQHTIEILKENHVDDILIIDGYLKDQIENYFGNGEKFSLNISYIEQMEFLGTAHATNLAKEFVGDNPFILIYGDLFMDKNIFQSIISTFNENDFEGIIAAKEMPDPSKWGILKIDTEGNLQEIIEKPPDDRFGYLANAGLYIFTPKIFEAIKNTNLSTRKEYELTDSISICISSGSKFHIQNISNFYWSDIGHPWQLLDASTYLISQLPGDPVSKENLPPKLILNEGGIIENFVTIHGTVKIGQNTIIKSGTYIEGPVIIGENCTIGPNAYLRPYTTIGHNCKVGNGSEIKGSIIMNNSAIPHLSYVGDSIIGENVNFGCGSITANLRLDKKAIQMSINGTKVKTHRKKLGTVIGDNTQFGVQVSIMPGITIGSNSFIGSNTIVNKNVPKNSTYYGKVNNASFIKNDEKKSS